MAADVLTRDEVAALVRAAAGVSRRSRARTAIRNQALLVLLWRTGLRLDEALSLRPSHLDKQAGTVHVRKGKGNKSRTVPIDPGSQAIVCDYLDERASWKTQRTSPLFCTLVGGKLAQQYVRALCVRLAVRAELGKHVHPHMFRHTYASELMREGFNVRKIQELMGHATLGATEIYLRSIGAMPELIEAVHARPSIDLEMGPS